MTSIQNSAETSPMLDRIKEFIAKGKESESVDQLHSYTDGGLAKIKELG